MSRPRRFQRTIIYYTIGSVLVSIILTGAAALSIAGRILRTEIVDKNNVLVSTLVRRVEDYLDESVNDLVEISNLVAARDSVTPSELRAFLGNFARSHESIQSIQVVGFDGIVQTTYPDTPGLAGFDLSRQPFFQKMKQADSRTWSVPYISPASGSPVVAFAIPLENGALISEISIDTLNRIIQTDHSVATNTFITLTSQNAVFIAHPDERMVQQQAHDPLFNNFIDEYTGGILVTRRLVGGEPHICSVDFIPKNGWALVIYQPYQAVFSPLRFIALVFVLLIVVMSSVGLFISSRLARDLGVGLRNLALQADDIAGGNYEHRIHASEYEELAQLAYDINDMAEKIRTRESEITRKNSRLTALTGALRNSQQLLNTIITNVPEVIYSRDLATGQITYISPKCLQVYGYSPADFRNRHSLWESIIHPDDREAVREAIEGSPVGSTYNLEYRVTAKDGQIIWIQESGNIRAEAADGRSHIDSTTRDISQEKALENHYQHAQRLESLGRLAGGVAHDFNNLLTTILGYSDLLLNPSSTNGESAGYVGEIQNAARRAVDLTAKLLAFSRKQVRQSRSVHIDTLLRDLKPMLGRLIGEHIIIEYKLDGANTTINADPSQIEQVIVNLAINARDAMEDGGVLTIESSVVGIDEDYELEPSVLLNPGTYVRIVISDTGSGIDEEIRDRLFEPFFTTKDIGKGTGLGLAMAYGTVTQSNGSISATNRESGGTSFTILLPVTGESTNEYRSSELPKSAKKHAHSGSIILVEDEESLRMMIVRILKELGYDVEAFANSADALEYLMKGNGSKSFDLLITDVVMPGMGGPELVRQVEAIVPDLRYLYISGYGISEESVSTADLENKLLKKPFAPNTLAEKVLEMIRGA